MNNISCFPRQELDKNGSTLLKLSIALIKKIKKKYNITRIELVDHSTKVCNDDKGSRLILSKMLILLTGETWYGRCNFIPFYQHDKENKDLITLYKKNILDFFDECYNDDELVKIFLTGLLKNHFLSNKEYDGTCIIFKNFYEILFKKLKLHDLYGKSYYMEI